MVDALRKLLLAGLGTLDLTEEKAKTIFNDLVARGQMSGKEALQHDVEEAAAKTMSAMGLAKKSEVEALNARVAALERKLAEARGGGAPDDTMPGL